MPDDGNYLLTNVGFSRNEKPILLLQSNEAFVELDPIGRSITLQFDMKQRFCVGWRDITSGERFFCPNHHPVEAKYEQCSACQKRTGFNPAFYHSSTISAQQEARNQEPHLLYLAHFGPGVIKVGISLAARANSRLLEQGARTALVLDTFPSAHIARQYEAQIAAIPGIAETVQQRKKTELLFQSYDPDAGTKELISTKSLIEQKLGKSFTGNDYLRLDTIYFPHTPPRLVEAYDLSDNHMISGTAIGMVGSVLCCRQGDLVLCLALKKHVGYYVTLSNSEIPIDVPARQTSLF